jgi:glycosyltransferase involved in cell wall biosynthesis
VSLSVAIITKNEEANLRRTLESVKWADEIVVVDSGSTDRTCEIAREYGARVFVEEWKGFAKQKNSAIEKCTSDWILSLDADEEVLAELSKAIKLSIKFLSAQELPDPEGDWLHDFVGIRNPANTSGFRIWRENFFLGRPIRRGGYFPDPKLRLVRKGMAGFEARAVHEDMTITSGDVAEIWVPLRHHAYPNLSGYIEHMNRYSDLGAEMVVETKGKVGFSFINIVLRPLATFIYNYFLRLGFLDGREGLLLHLYHSAYVSWKYAKAWELSSSERRGKKE